MPGLIVSVRDAEEIPPVLAAGAALLDIKEPANGSLGRAPDTVRETILDAVAGRVPVSVALGELRDDRAVQIDLSRLTFVKFGMAGCADLDWRGMLTEARTRIETDTRSRLVVAAYADWQRACAPRPRDVCQHAVEERVSVLLLDTWGKDGSTLLDWISVGEAGELVARCRSAGVLVALAGALGRRQIEELRPAAPDWYAVRSAVCVRGVRTTRIDPARVSELVAFLRQKRGGCDLSEPRTK